MIFNFISSNSLPARDPQLMPTFPELRNMKSSKPARETKAPTTITDGTSTFNSFPAISDLLGSIVKRKKYE